MPVTFQAELVRGDDQDTMGIVVPEHVVEALGAGRRPAVVVAVLGHTYRSTVARMGGQYLVGVSQEQRAQAGITDERTVEVTLEVDTAPRDVAVPEDLAAALDAAGVAEGWQRLAPSARKELVRQIETAKRAETRAARVTKAVDAARSRQP
ncbi:MAG: YdeI/OmpD-associated family protein [Candidatus Nanopelagicales bacterium]|nr:YdeI/OmpD-associated family protein [Candidatus Nanopelagicales bacterium]